MRFTKCMVPVSMSERTILLASAALVVSGLLQVATAWFQWQIRLSEGDMGYSCPSHEVGNHADGVDIDLGRSRKPNMQKREYTWDGEDYPPSLDFVSSVDLNANLTFPSGGEPLNIGEPVALTIEDSRHYALNGPDASDDTILEIDAEWESVYPGGSAGFVRLGPERRFFGLSLYHQLHCLDALRFAVGGRTHAARSSSTDRQGGASPHTNGRRAEEVSHTAHCLNYLRQTILCAADVTLEPELVRGAQDVGSGLGVTHVCRDWEKVHSFVERNYEAYVAWTDSEEGGEGMND